MQTDERRGDGIFLVITDRARPQRLARYPGHDDQGRVRADVFPDRPGRKPRRVAREQLQRPPLATRLTAIEPPLTVIDV